MLSDTDIERLFEEWKTPTAGRALIRKIRNDGPVRNLQHRMDGVRTRFVSKKMGRAVYAESRTCEFPALYLREFDPETTEYWPQPCVFDLEVSGPLGGKTRLQHTPDLFVVEHGFIIEEWRQEARLLRYAQDRPHLFHKDIEGRWHYAPVEAHLENLGIEYRLKSADEHPRIYLSNLSFLEEYHLETTPVVPDDVRQRIVALFDQQSAVPHLSLIQDHGFKADHVFQLLLEGTAYVDLHRTKLSNTSELIVYRDKDVGRAAHLLKAAKAPALPSSGLDISPGCSFNFQGKSYEVVLRGNTDLILRDHDGKTSTLPIQVVEDLFHSDQVSPLSSSTGQLEFDANEILSSKQLSDAIRRLDILNTDSDEVSERTRARWRKKISGISAPQDQLTALMCENPGNRTQRLPPEVLKLAEEVLNTFHNKHANPSTSATYSFYIDACETAGIRAMSRSSFYEWISRHESIEKREGKRKAYELASIPLTFDYEHPVHGVLPHEVCYCDHTIMNVFLKGLVIDDLGKPTITLMVDGALSKPRAFYLSYRPAGTTSVLMCLRDYVRRNGRLPRILVLDNGKEFHSEALKAFASVFGISIRWRRRSRPRDSTVIERMLGASEDEVIRQLSGNSRALKDPRKVSSTHDPQKHITWTLPALHGSLEHYFFETQPKRIHPRFGVSPNDYEYRLRQESGARGHVLIKYDSTLRMLTAPHPRIPTRHVDRQRGVYVDGVYHWHDKLAHAKPGQQCEVRVELWRASVVYVCFEDEWLIAQARDGGVLNGRFRAEFELQKREENRARKSLAQKDKVSVENSKKRVELWLPERWDERLREQMTEEYYTYEKLKMTEVITEAKNVEGQSINLGLPQIGSLDLIKSVQSEYDPITPSISEVIDPDDYL